MAKIITFSRYFPAYHPKAGQPTHFVEKFINSIPYYRDKVFPKEIAKIFNYEYFNNNCEYKHHTIRAGHRFKAGDYFSPRVWSGKPYRSKQIVIAPDTPIKKVWDFRVNALREDANILLNGGFQDKHLVTEIAKNDGLEFDDFLDWFKFPTDDFDGQIICWNENVNY